MIQASNITKHYGDKVAVDAISFTVAPARSPVSSARTAPASRPRCA